MRISGAAAMFPYAPWGYFGIAYPYGRDQGAAGNDRNGEGFRTAALRTRDRSQRAGIRNPSAKPSFKFSRAMAHRDPRTNPLSRDDPSPAIAGSVTVFSSANGRMRHLLVLPDEG